MPVPTFVRGLALALGIALLGPAWVARAAPQPLNIFIYSEYLDPEVVKDFEKKFDAKVTVDLFEDSESMLAKLQSGGGPYDIVVPSDYTVPAMVKMGMLAPLRRERLSNFKNLDPRFLGTAFDPKNEHTVPYQWGTMGLYLRRIPGKPLPDSWAAIFDPAAQYGPFVLIDSMRDAIGAALKYKGHGLNSLKTEELKEARDVLVAAKARSAAFEATVGGKNRVLGKSAVAAIVASGDAARGMLEDAATVYVIPKEGAEVYLDNLAIPARASHRDLAEKFIDFILEAKVGARISKYCQGSSPNAASRAFIDADDLKNPAIYPSPETMGRLEYLKDLGAGTRLYDQIWTQIKAR